MCSVMKLPCVLCVDVVVCWHMDYNREQACFLLQGPQISHTTLETQASQRLVHAIDPHATHFLLIRLYVHQGGNTMC